MKRKIISTLLLAGTLLSAGAQTVTLDSIIAAIGKSNPELKMYDAGIRSSDEAAKGARNWEAPLLGTGFWMTPYNPRDWKKGSDGSPGMGQYQLSFQQMFPNGKKLDADEKYMKSVSSPD